MSKLRPILFNTEMVQAIMEDRKRQTRRILKGKTCHFVKVQTDNLGTAIPYVRGAGSQWWAEPYIQCPYGKVGDVLWVRETHLWVSRDHAHDLLEGNQDGIQWVYKTSVHEDWFQYAKEKYGYKWKPSIHMPFEACRLFLEITNIRVERLQEISNSDAVSEGIKSVDHGVHWKNYEKNEISCFIHPKFSFASLWQSVYGAESWDANWWVWVIEFKQIPKPITLLTPTR